MPEINLLPDDLRRKESKQLDSAKKRPSGFNIKFHEPEKEIKVKSNKPSFFSKLFAPRPKKPEKIIPKNNKSKDELEKKDEIKSVKLDKEPLMTQPSYKPRAKDEIKFDFKNDSALISDLKIDELILPEPEKRTEKINEPPKPIIKTVPVAASAHSQHLLKKPSWLTRIWLSLISKKPKASKPSKSPLPIRGQIKTPNQAPKNFEKKFVPVVPVIPAPLPKVQNIPKDLLPPPAPKPFFKPVEPKKPFVWPKFSIFKKKVKLPPKDKTVNFVKSNLENKKSTQPEKREKSVYLDINLIPEDLSKMPERRFSEKLIITGIVFSALVLAIIFGYLGLTWYQIIITRQIQDVKDEIVIIDSQIKTYKDDEKNARELQAKLKLIEDLLNNHIYWTKFFSLLEKYTIDEVYYTNFSMSGRDLLVISAIGKDYAAVAKQLLVFNEAKEFVKSARVDGASAVIEKSGDYTGVTFSINLEFQPDVFLKPIE